MKGYTAMGSVRERSTCAPCARIRRAVAALLLWPWQCKQNAAQAWHIDFRMTAVEPFAGIAEPLALLLYWLRDGFLWYPETDCMCVAQACQRC